MNLDLEDKKRIHFIGIGGSGMGGIAEVLLTHGFEVSGSDSSQNNMTQRLAGLGATVYEGHKSDQVNGAEIVVLSSAITDDNPELVAAKQKNLIIIQRAKMLSALMKNYFGIAVAGTHGKTTTTSLLASILAEGGLDPTFVIGGLLKSAGCNAQLGKSRYFVAEADESDASFLLLDSKVAVVTNIDADHLGTYDNDFEQLKNAFVEFVNNLPEDGYSILCYDDAVVRTLIPRFKGKKITYGFHPDADIVATEMKPDGMQTHIKIRDNRNGKQWQLTLNLPGKHNVENALAAIAVALEFGVSTDDIGAALEKFAGVARRMQRHGDFEINQGSVTLIEDYGHHPRELEATISALRDAWPNRRIVMVFQPHRYTRTQSLWHEFVEVLGKPDKLVLLDIYSANEPEIPGISSQHLFDEINKKTKTSPCYLDDVERLTQVLHEEMQDGDVVLLQGAGSVGRICAELAERKLT